MTKQRLRKKYFEMNTRLRAIFLAAAGLLGSAVAITLGDALKQASPETDCRQWSAFFDNVSRAEAFEMVEWFFLVPRNDPTPVFFGSEILGECLNGSCRISPDGCDASYVYTYSVIGIHDDLDLVRLEAPLIIVKAWKSWTDDLPRATFLGTWGDLQPRCNASPLTPQECRTLFEQSFPCHLLPGNTLCLYGKEYGPAQGTADCSPSPASRPIPCNSKHGRHYARRARDKVHTDEDFE